MNEKKKIQILLNNLRKYSKEQSQKVQRESQVRRISAPQVDRVGRKKQIGYNLLRSQRPWKDQEQVQSFTKSNEIRAPQVNEDKKSGSVE